MAFFKAVKFNSLAEFKTVEPTILVFLNNNNIKKWGCKTGSDGSVLCILDGRLNGFDWKGLIPQTFSTDNLVYFPKIKLH